MLTQEIKLQNSQFSPLTNESVYKSLHLKKRSQDGLLISFIVIWVVFRILILNLKEICNYVQQTPIELESLYQAFSYLPCVKEY